MMGRENILSAVVSEKEFKLHRKGYMDRETGFRVLRYCNCSRNGKRMEIPIHMLQVSKTSPSSFYQIITKQKKPV